MFNGIKWLNEKNIEEQLKHENLVAITLKYPPNITLKYLTKNTDVY